MAKDTHKNIFLSLVVPVYRQERTIEKDFENIKTTLDGINKSYEIIIVIDGDFDKTYEKIKDKRSQIVKIYQLKENRGKGYAVKFGMSKASGEIVGFIDSGMDLDPTGISMLLNHMEWYNADIVIGSKLHPVSQVNYPFFRKVLSWGYRTLTRILFGFKVRDTQVGLKFFKKNVSDRVFPLLIIKGFAFDVEMLAVAYSLGYTRIFEAPIKLDFGGGVKSSINASTLVKTISRMLLDTFIIFYRIKIARVHKRQEKVQVAVT